MWVRGVTSSRHDPVSYPLLFPLFVLVQEAQTGRRITPCKIRGIKSVFGPREAEGHGRGLAMLFKVSSTVQNSNEY